MELSLLSERFAEEVAFSTNMFARLGREKAIRPSLVMGALGLFELWTLKCFGIDILSLCH